MTAHSSVLAWKIQWTEEPDGLQSMQSQSQLSDQARLCMLSTHSCPTRCDPVDCSPPGCSVLGILQARTLEWVVMPSSRGSS